MNLNKLKLLYLFNAIYVYSFYAFRNLIIEKVIELTKPQQSILNGIVYFISFFVNILITFLSDKFKTHKITLISSLTVSSACFQLMLMSKNLYIFSFFYFFVTSMNQVLNPILDIYILGSSFDYAKIRVYDAYGYIISTCLSELGYNFLNQDINKGYLYFRIFNFASFIVLISMLHYFLTKKVINSQKGIQTKKKNAFIRFSLLILTVLLIGMNRTSTSNFLSHYHSEYLKLNLNNNRIVLAVCLSFGVLGEIIIFNVPLTKLFGLFYPLLIGSLFQLLRFILYYVLKPTHTHLFLKVCMIETMKGLTFSMVHVSCTSLSKMYGGKYESMAQFIYNGTYIALGNLFSGLLFSSSLDHGNDFSYFFKSNIIVCLSSIFLIILSKMIYKQGWSVK